MVGVVFDQTKTTARKIYRWWIQAIRSLFEFTQFGDIWGGFFLNDGYVALASRCFLLWYKKKEFMGITHTVTSAIDIFFRAINRSLTPCISFPHHFPLTGHKPDLHVWPSCPPYRPSPIHPIQQYRSVHPCIPLCHDLSSFQTPLEPTQEKKKDEEEDWCIKRTKNKLN